MIEWLSDLLGRWLECSWQRKANKFQERYPRYRK
jgi:hypothetical protein